MAPTAPWGRIVQNKIAADQLQPDRILKVHQVALRLSRPTRTIRYWAETGILPGFKIGFRQWGFSERAIQEFIRKLISPHNPEPANLTGSNGSTGTYGRNGEH
jgi:Helix-turn-helix domain